VLDGSDPLPFIGDIDEMSANELAKEGPIYNQAQSCKHTKDIQIVEILVRILVSAVGVY
jgi:hypothetical protein